MPGHFGPAERAKMTPHQAWELVEDRLTGTSLTQLIANHSCISGRVRPTMSTLPEDPEMFTGKRCWRGTRKGHLLVAPRGPEPGGLDVICLGYAERLMDPARRRQG
jgi:hypothetical protein